MRELTEGGARNDARIARANFIKRVRRHRRSRTPTPGMPDDTPQAVPIIDISPFASPSSHDDEARAETAEKWDRPAGKAWLCNHLITRVTIETISAVRAGAMSFFTLDAESKNSFNYGPYGNPLGGYTGMGTEAQCLER